MHHFQVRKAGDNLDDDNIKGRPLFDEGFGGGAAAQWLQMAKIRRNKSSGTWCYFTSFSKVVSAESHNFRFR